MKTHVVIINRSAPASTDGWIHIVPKGELPNREAGIVQVLDDPALDSILTGIAADCERLGDKWPGIYAGREHFIYHPDQDSAALAWFKEFQKRDDGIWAKADGLTNLGTEAVKNRLYKFTSFVADRGNLQKIEPTADSAPDAVTDTALPRYRVMKIDTVGFTNQANGKELLTPITNRSSEPETKTPPAIGGAMASPARTVLTSRLDSHMADDNVARGDLLLRDQLLPLLNLPANADTNAVLAEISRVQNRVTTLTAENQTLLAEQVDAILADHSLTDLKITNRLRPVLLPLANRAERVAFLAELGLKPDAKIPRPARVLNRGGSPAIARPVATNPDEQLLARKIQNRATELQATGLKFDTAWKQAQREAANNL